MSPAPAQAPIVACERASTMPDIGNHPRWSANTEMTNMASRNSGTDSVVIAMSPVNRSTRDPRRTACHVPSATPPATPSDRPTAIKSNVRGMTVRSTAATGSLCVTDQPRSPRA